jgi:hypothetical protein
MNHLDPAVRFIKMVPGSRRLARALGLSRKRTGVSDQGVQDERRFLLELLPQNAVGAEIGVHLGDFSQLMLEVACPIELHLIDPWKCEASDNYKSTLYGGKARGGQREMDRR